VGAFGTGIQGSIENLLAEWWGLQPTGFSGLYDYSFSPLDAANLVVGGNPLYQISDFLAVYPKFGIQPQGLVSVSPNAVTPGEDYVVGDQLTVLGIDAQGGIVTVVTVDSNGEPTLYTINTPGIGYQVTPQVNAIGGLLPTPSDGGVGYIVNDLVAINQPGGYGGIGQVTSVDVNGSVTGIAVASNGGGNGYAIGGDIPCSGGSGVGLLVNITSVIPYVGSQTQGGTGGGATVNITAITAPNIVCIPPAVLQMYINLASACLQSARWCEMWPVAMALFVAHFTTLYLRSEGNVGSTAGQIAASGLTRGIMVTKSAGNVAATIEIPRGLDEWAAYTSTEYGVQLATFAKGIGALGMYIW
jgi:hypothetical protein